MISKKPSKAPKLYVDSEAAKDQIQRADESSAQSDDPMKSDVRLKKKESALNKLKKKGAPAPKELK